MSELEVKQSVLPDPNQLYNQGKQEIGNLRELKVGEGSSIFFTDREGSRWGHPTFGEAKAYIKVDGSFKFKAGDGTVIMDSLGDGGNFVNVINTALNTSSKTILSDFTFEATDYAGAFKAGNPTWDEITGLITGGSGVLINARGILGANAGVATFTLDATTGNATFAGTLVAAAGTIGIITLASGGNIKSGKTAYSDDTNAGFWLGLDSGTAKLNIGSSASKYIHYDGVDFSMLGGTITGGTIQTATSGYRIKLNGSNSKMELLNGGVVLASVYASASGDIVLDGTDDVSLAIGGSIKCYASSGSFKPNSDRAYDLGEDTAQWNNVYGTRYYAGSSGTAGFLGPSTYGFLTALRISGSPGSVSMDGKYREITFIGGIVTNVSSETGWIFLDSASGI